MRNLSILLIMVVALLSSCKTDHTKLLPNVTGKSGEVVLVIEPDHWSSAIGTELKKTLTQQHPALPQKEPMFDLIHIPYKAFSNIFKTHRNVVLVKIDKELSEPKIIIQEDIWAKPQLIINVLAPNKDGLEKLAKESGDVLAARILKAEMGRYADNYAKYEQLGLANMIQKRFGIRLTLPKGYTMDLDTTNFVWIENRGRGDMVQGIFIYSYDKPENELTSEYIFSKRNEFTKKFVPGPAPNSYMTVETETDWFRREIKVNDIDVIELRNLWRVENDFMGGPFVSFTLVDDKTNKVICIDGFVYAPQFDKRDYIRQVEAILNSVVFPESK